MVAWQKGVKTHSDLIYFLAQLVAVRGGTRARAQYDPRQYCPLRRQLFIGPKCDGRTDYGARLIGQVLTSIRRTILPSVLPPLTV